MDSYENPERIEPTFYDLLGVNMNAPWSVVEQAYETRIRKLESAEDEDSGRVLLFLGRLHETLLSPRKRAAYNRVIIHHNYRFAKPRKASLVDAAQ